MESVFAANEGEPRMNLSTVLKASADRRGWAITAFERVARTTRLSGREAQEAMMAIWPRQRGCLGPKDKGSTIIQDLAPISKGVGSNHCNNFLNRLGVSPASRTMPPIV